MAVRLTRIWTGTGDDGSTGLGDFSRVPKTDPRLQAYADVDETGAALGLVLAALPPAPGAPTPRAADAPTDAPAVEGPPGQGTDDAGEVPVLEHVRGLVRRVQNDLFDVGADLCLPLGADVQHEPLRVREPWLADLEREIDALAEALPQLTSFVLAGGTPAAAHLHLARTVARRAERSTWAALEAYGTGDGGVSPLAARYLNRLSDLLFVLARAANTEALGGDGDVLWRPGGDHTSDPGS